MCSLILAAKFSIKLSCEFLLKVSHSKLSKWKKLPNFSLGLDVSASSQALCIFDYPCTFGKVKQKKSKLLYTLNSRNKYPGAPLLGLAKSSYWF